MRKIIYFVSEFDGSARQAVILGPDSMGDELLPLVIVPHAAAFSAEATAAYWRDIPAKRGVIAVFPFGHPRKLELFSFGWHGQIEDLASLPRILTNIGYPVDASRVYGVGISMGGMEVLLLAGKHPGLLAGVVAFNSVVDLDAWFYDTDMLKPQMMEEIGNTPEEMPEEYAERSPINYAATIARIPVLLYWDPIDKMVRFQSEKQSGLLYRKVKEADPDAPIEERIHHYGHFWVRPGLALDWLMSPKDFQ